MIENPILRGFNPDPSIIRVGDDYFIATSTFEWFPGVQIHHSKDLKHWTLIGQALTRKSQLDLKGVPDSCGVWAPCLSFDKGTFYLVYSCVRSFDGVWKDTPNYVVTTDDIFSDWSDPVYLSSRGFDGSMFHQSNGKKWFVNMLLDHRKGKFFGGIEMQEYDPDQRKLVGKVHYLTEGTELGCTEGPHILEKHGYYYLILAEGGTEYNHAISVARSKNLFGPFEFHPENPLLSAKDHPEHYLQKTGHGDLMCTQDGHWYVVFLTGRPLSKLGRCILGRETGIEELIWKDDWPYLKNGRLARQYIPDSGLKASNNKEPAGSKITFDVDRLPVDFQSLRIPIDEDWCSLKSRKTYLRLYGQQSLSSIHKQSMIARRVQSHHVEVSTEIEFEPQSFLHMAGLVFYYNTGHYHYATVTSDYNGSKKNLSVITCDNFSMIFQEELYEITDEKSVIVKGILQADKLQFYFSTDGVDFQNLGNPLDASILSDDYVREGGQHYRAAFTGCFVGICCQDLANNSHHADFKWFDYKEFES